MDEGSKMRKHILTSYKEFIKSIIAKIKELYDMSKRIGARPSILYAKDYFKNKKIICVEIGTLKGLNAKGIISYLNVIMLYCIDPWIKYTQSNKEVDNTEVYETAKKILDGFPAELIRKKSEQAINDIPDNIDFIYIDGNHDYEYIKKDIEMYYPKVKKGGIMAGHDFSIDYLGVVKAVMDFVEKNDLKLYGGELDWWFLKK